MNSSVYQHFRPDEYHFIDSVYDWIDQVENEYRPHLTNFLNPREQFIIEAVVGHRDTMTLHAFGGYPTSERQRCFLAPSYYEVGIEDFDIQLFEIDYPQNFSKLSHGHIMGSLLNLGLERNKFGDILNQSDRWQFLADQRILDFIRLEFNRVGRQAVIAQPLELDQVIEGEVKSLEKELVLSSLRLDILISQAFNLSRQQSKKMIQAEKVKLNWKPVVDGALDIAEQDILSVRGFGRVKLNKLLGKSKKNKWIGQVSILDRNR